MSLKVKNIFATLVAIVLLSSVESASACAACAGRTDSDLAKGMNWGIFTLLLVVMFVLSAFAAFFVFIVKKSAAHAALMSAETLPQTTQENLT
ncbi:MAG: hypothetical protein JWM68_5260 [Verrucomicrobiales bacterium]|nr:hypothetical protein [Verrucomicrobiales bacterium]